MKPRQLLEALFEAAVDAALPSKCVPLCLPAASDVRGGRVVVIGAGKASAAMASAVEQHYGNQLPLRGLVLTRYGHAVPCKHIEIVEAAHPVPDAAGQAAARRLLQETLANLSPKDLVIALISGGGSSLLALPDADISLADKQDLSRQLLACGATISEMNTVRKHISAIKGGRLAQACRPARVISVLISDVPGDDPGIIASGPTLPDSSTSADAWAVVQKYNLAPPATIAKHLQQGLGETPKPGNPDFARDEVHMVATPQMALEAAAARACELGVQAYILSDAIEGEARDIALMHSAVARQIVAHNQPFALGDTPILLLSGGETTVTIRGKGRGGRNVEFLLALANNLRGYPGIYALAADTDGVDGVEQIAGAIIDPQTSNRASAKGLHLAQELANNNGHGVFQALGDSLITGPTYTNVNDFRAIYIERSTSD